MWNHSHKKIPAFFFVVIASITMLITTHTAEAKECKNITIECGRILSVVNKKQPNKVYRLCGTATVPAKPTWFRRQCKLPEKPIQYLGMCRDFYPQCGCEKSPFYQQCEAQGYYFEISQKSL